MAETVGDFFWRRRQEWGVQTIFGYPGDGINGLLGALGRTDGAFISGGENISSLEVEEVLYQHPAILTAAVVAKPDPRWQEVPCAFVELKAGQTATAEEIMEFCKQHLARFKVPKDVVITEIPKTSTGKLQKFVLREWAKERAEGEFS